MTGPYLMNTYFSSLLAPELILDEAGNGWNRLNIFGLLEIFPNVQCYMTQLYLMNAHFCSFLGRAGSRWGMPMFF